MKPPQTTAHSPRFSIDRTSQTAVVATVSASVTRARDQLSGSFTLKPGLFEFDLGDLVIFVARRRRELDLVALDAADQRPAERRGIADPAVLGVCLGLADDLVFDLLVLV